MSKTLLRTALPHRLVSALVAGLVGLTLAVNPISSSTASASVPGVPAALGVRATQVAVQQIGVPYLWGGTTRAGFDCSGLTQYAWAHVGKRLPRTAQQQYAASIHLGRNLQRSGDLVFFYSGATIFHEGMYAGNGYMIVAPHSGTRVQRQRIWTTHVLYGRVR